MIMLPVDYLSWYLMNYFCVIAALVESMVEAQRGNALSPHILRFMAHFVLFLRSLDKVAAESSVSFTTAQ